MKNIYLEIVLRVLKKNNIKYATIENIQTAMMYVSDMVKKGEKIKDNDILVIVR